MPEGWGGGGEGLQNDGNEKRQGVQGRERRKKDGSREDGWSEEGLKGVTLIHKAKPKKTKKSVCGMDTPTFSNPSFEMSQRKTTRLYIF